MAEDKQSEAEAEASRNQELQYRKISDEELQRILAEHEKWRVKAGKEGQRADLSNIDLPGRDLHGADLGQADLHGAHLTFADLHGAILWEADLRADLSFSNFNGAELTRADLRSANLFLADFSEAKLDHADLTRATGAQPDQFAYADLTAAKLPEELRNFQEPLRTLEEAARNCRKLFLSTLLACAYSVVAIFSTPVENQLTLPIIQTKVEFDDLLIAMPVVLFCVFVYLHLNLRLLWRRLSRLPAIFPDGRTLTEKAYPWLLIGLVRNHLTTLPGKDKSWGYWFQRLVSIVLAWVATPATIALFAVASSGRSASWVSYLIAVEFGLCATAALLFWRDADQALKGEHREH